MKKTNTKKISIITAITLFMSFLPLDFQKVYSYGEKNLNGGNEVVVDSYENIATYLDKNQVVDIPDINLAREIKKELGKNEDDVVTVGDMERLTILSAYNKGISDLSGIQFATNLNWLLLSENNIEDISLLTGLTNLEGLSLDNNNIQDVSSISELINLKSLGLSNNKIKNINVLVNLSKLESLYLSYNMISDISVLSKFTGLKELGLSNNEISSVEPLQYLTNLTMLYVSNNRIFDLSPLKGIKFYHIEAGEQRPILESVTVKDKTTLIVEIPRIYNHNGDEVPIRYVTFYDGIYEEEVIHNNNIVEIPIETNQNRTARLRVNFYQSNIFFGEMTKEIIIESDYDGVSIVPDKNLEKTIKEKLGLGDETPLTEKHMERFQSLYVSTENIESIEGLQYAKNLEQLDINNNKIKDLTPIKELNKLEELRAGMNLIEDISPLSNLKNLKSISCEENLIEDITPLSNLIELTDLKLWTNKIKSVEPLAGLENLRVLSISGNEILDLSPLKKLNLNYVYAGNQKVNLSAIEVKEGTSFIYDIPIIKDIDGSIANVEWLNFNDGIKVHTFYPQNNKIEIAVSTAESTKGNISFEFKFPDNSQGTDFRGSVNQEILIISNGQPEIVDIPDKNLDEAIRNSLDIDDGVPLTTRDMKNLTSIYLSNSYGKVNLRGLEHATNLYEVNLYTKEVENIDILNSLPYLERLFIYAGDKVDFSTGFRRLKYLNMSNNIELDESKFNFKNLPNLEKLSMAMCSIDDISFLEGLSGLTELNILGNNFNDISSIASLKNLKKLDISQNMISDFTPIKALENLTELNLNNVNIKDLSVLDNLNNLKYLELMNNNIEDISTLSNIDRFTRVDLSYNRIRDLTPLGEKPKGSVKVLEQRIELEEVEINIGDTFTYNAPPILDNKGVNVNRNGSVQLKDEQDNYISEYTVNRGKAIIENLQEYGMTYQLISSKATDTIQYSYKITQNLVGLKGDFDNNGVVDAMDLAMITSRYNMDSSHVEWQEKFDINKDGIIDIYDLVFVSSKFE